MQLDALHAERGVMRGLRRDVDGGAGGREFGGKQEATDFNKYACNDREVADVRGTAR